MRAYETTFILAPSLDAEGTQKEIDDIKGLITAGGGEITTEKEWGRRRLAFPIQNHAEGIYHILRFSLDSGKLPELDRHFKLNENVLRALVIRDEGLPLDHIGQPSESDYRDRDSRREGGRFDRDRDRDRGPRRSYSDRPERSGRPERSDRPEGAATANATTEASSGDAAPAASDGGEEKSSE